MAVLALLYGATAYAFFLASFLYAIGFVGNLLVPTSVDSGAVAPLGTALVIDLLLLALFALQHSVMARRGFKRWWTRIVPVSLERSTYVLAASAALALLLWQWRPIAEPLVWSVQHPAGVALLHAVFWLGFTVALASTFMIDHFELFGLRQVWSRLVGHAAPRPQFSTPGLYRHVRHPLYLGLLLGFWATPTMTAGHLLFAAGSTAYILLGIWFEERDLIAQFGDHYRLYRERVGMLMPRSRRAKRAPRFEP
jgi:protein-S-isoprenylcysteine O-methyltransferase Ste14